MASTTTDSSSSSSRTAAGFQDLADGVHVEGTDSWDAAFARCFSFWQDSQRCKDWRRPGKQRIFKLGLHALVLSPDADKVVVMAQPMHSLWTHNLGKTTSDTDVPTGCGTIDSRGGRRTGMLGFAYADLALGTNYGLAGGGVITSEQYFTEASHGSLQPPSVASVAERFFGEIEEEIGAAACAKLRAASPDALVLRVDPDWGDVYCTVRVRADVEDEVKEFSHVAQCRRAMVREWLGEGEAEGLRHPELALHVLKRAGHEGDPAGFVKAFGSRDEVSGVDVVDVAQAPHSFRYQQIDEQARLACLLGIPTPSWLVRRNASLAMDAAVHVQDVWRRATSTCASVDMERARDAAAMQSRVEKAAEACRRAAEAALAAHVSCASGSGSSSSSSSGGDVADVLEATRDASRHAYQTAVCASACFAKVASRVAEPAQRVAGFGGNETVRAAWRWASVAAHGFTSSKAVGRAGDRTMLPEHPDDKAARLAARPPKPPHQQNARTMQWRRHSTGAKKHADGRT